MNKKIIVISFLIIFIGLFYIVPAIIQTIRPNIIVDSTNLRTGFIGLDFTVWIDVSVHNEGGKGNAIITVTLHQGTNFWKKTQDVYLTNLETEDLTFTFWEVSFWSKEGGSYDVEIDYY